MTISPVAPQQGSTPSQAISGAAVTTDAVTAGGAATSNAPAISSSSTISSIADLKRKAPALYKQMMLGIATSMCNEFRRDQERLKKIMREGNQS